MSSVLTQPPNRALAGLGNFPFRPFLEDFDVWEYLPMDQGGRLVQLALLGTEKDAGIVTGVRQPGFFSAWGTWDALENTEREKSVWLNRWYFLPSFAREYARTGEETCLRELLDFVARWWADNPVPEDLPAYFATRRYNWRDMQVAWRAHNLIWSYFLIRGGLSEDEDQLLRDIIEAHGRVLLSYFGAQELHENNHQSHGALAMLYVGALFPGFKLAPVLVRRAVAILEHHLEHSFLPDGNSLELCPGYYPFIASIFRDAWLLCQANDIEPPRRSLERMCQFRDYLLAVQQPDGTVPPINDSTEMDATASLRILENIVGPSETAPASRWLESSGHAVMRDRSWYAFLDAGPTMLWHWHGGKLGFHLWHEGEPILIDSGICNYDDPQRLAWYCTPQAHNTLLVDGRGDRLRDEIPFAEKAPAGCEIIGWESNERYDLASMAHSGFPAAQGSLRWVRQFLLLKNRFVVIVDRVQSEQIHDYEWLFHFSPGRVEPCTRGVRAFFSQPHLDLIAAGCSSVTLDEQKIHRTSRHLPAMVAHFASRAASTVGGFVLAPAGLIEGPVTLDYAEAMGKVSLHLETSTGPCSLDFSRLDSSNPPACFLHFSS